MENLPKVLVASPTYDVMKYCEKEFLTRLKELDYPSYDILIVDNSKNDDYFNHLREEYKNVIIMKDDSIEPKNLLRLINSRNKILDYAVKNNYDYVLMMDSDVIPPKNILTELLNCKKDIVSGVYYNYFVIDGKTEWWPVAWIALTEKEFDEIKEKIQLPDFIKSNLDLRVHLTNEEANSNKLIEVAIPSAGCMLMSRKVFTTLNYSLFDTNEYNNLQTGDEIKFILEAKKLGFKIYVNTAVKCEHLVMGKFEKKGNTYTHPMFKE